MINQPDAILVLGGGLTPDANPHPWVIARLQAAIEKSNTAAIICLSAYTPHKPPPLDRFGYPIPESLASASYLMKLGCPPRRILIESCSYDTIGNAFFARVQHLTPRGFRKLLVVTSDFHMPRTQDIFQTVLSLNEGAQKSAFELDFLATPNDGLDGKNLLHRLEKEQKALEAWIHRKNCMRWDNIGAFHQWLYQEHECYAVGMSPQRNSAPYRNSY